jgi:hypothetical protein
MLPEGFLREKELEGKMRSPPRKSKKTRRSTRKQNVQKVVLISYSNSEENTLTI